jgi:hypothetical protein
LTDHSASAPSATKIYELDGAVRNSAHVTARNRIDYSLQIQRLAYLVSLASVSPPIAPIHFIIECPISGCRQKWGNSVGLPIRGYCKKWISTTAASFTEYGA